MPIFIKHTGFSMNSGLIIAFLFISIRAFSLGTEWDKLAIYDPTKLLKIKKTGKDNIVNINHRLFVDNFLTKNSCFLEQIICDHEFLKEAHIKNSQTAYILCKIAEHSFKILKNQNILDKYEFVFAIKLNELIFQVQVRLIPGIDCSPIDLEAETNIDTYKITRLDTKTCISYKGYFHDMVSKFGFYGGENSWHRLAPSKIISFFNLSNK